MVCFACVNVRTYVHMHAHNTHSCVSMYLPSSCVVFSIIPLHKQFALQLTWASRCRLSSPKLPCSDAKESKPNNQVFLTGPKVSIPNQCMHYIQYILCTCSVIFIDSSRSIKLRSVRSTSLENSS